MKTTRNLERQINSLLEKDSLKDYVLVEVDSCYRRLFDVKHRFNLFDAFCDGNFQLEQIVRVRGNNKKSSMTLEIRKCLI